MKILEELYLKNKEIVNYALVGVLTTIVSLVSYYVCVLTFLDSKDSFQLQIANIVSWISAVGFAYITNRKYVFESKNRNRFAEIVKFVGVRISTLLMDMAFMAIFVSVLRFNDKWVKMVDQLVIIAVNYIFSKLFVFRKQV